MADEIRNHEIQKLNKNKEELTSDEEQQINEEQIKFFRQMLKQPAQALSGGAFLTYNAFLHLVIKKMARKALYC